MPTKPPPFTVGQRLRLRDGEIRIDRITDEWVYFVSFPLAKTGAPTRMAPTLFAAAVAQQMPARAPHLDAPPCPSCAGPLVPLDGSTADPGDDDTRPLAIFCAACGDRWNLDLTDPADVRTFARLWWSAGAWAGKQHTEENRK